MNLRADTHAITSGGQQIAGLAGHLQATIAAAEHTIGNVASEVGHADLQAMLNNLRDTLRSASRPAVDSVLRFGLELREAGVTYEDTDNQVARGIEVQF